MLGEGREEGWEEGREERREKGREEGCSEILLVLVVHAEGGLVTSLAFEVPCTWHHKGYS